MDEHLQSGMEKRGGTGNNSFKYMYKDDDGPCGLILLEASVRGLYSVTAVVGGPTPSLRAGGAHDTHIHKMWLSCSERIDGGCRFVS